MPPEMALQKAQEQGLDLVEISPDARPPVCKIMDYGKFKYAQKKKEAETRRNQVIVQLKEVKFRPKIEQHDFDTKVGHIRAFLKEGHKAKVTLMFRGREITHPELGRRVLERVAEEIKDLAVVEQFPRLDGRNMTMVVGPSGKPAATHSPAPASETKSAAPASATKPAAPASENKPAAPAPAVAAASPGRAPEPRT